MYTETVEEVQDFSESQRVKVFPVTLSGRVIDSRCLR